MKTVSLLLVGMLCLSVVVFPGEVITNDTGEDATGLHVTFSEPVMITAFGDALTSVDPQMLSFEFVFSGSTVEPWESHWFNYAPATASVMEFEWLAAPAAIPAEPNYKAAFNVTIGSEFDRAANGTPFTSFVPNLGIESPALQARYTTFLELLRRCTGNDLPAVRDATAIAGLADSLQHGWGEAITVLLGTEVNGTHEWVDDVIDELNALLGEQYLVRVSRRDQAEWRFDYSSADFRKKRAIHSSISLSNEGNPLSCLFEVHGLFAFENDFKSRLRRAFAEVLLLYADYDSALVERLGYDEHQYEVTRFSNDFANLVLVLSQLENGRDFSQDLNEVNSSPVAVTPEVTTAKVGEIPVLDGSSSFDPDGSITSQSWRQVLAEKTDLDYMSNHIVVLSDPTSMRTTFTPQWPGNYRFELTVLDDEGAVGTATTDIEVVWASNPLGVRGVNALAYWDPSGLDTFIPEMLSEFVSTYNIEWISFAPYWWMTNPYSNEVHPLGDWYAGAPGGTVRDADLKRLIELFHSYGLKVLLRPTLEFHGWTDWRGNLEPTNWRQWFSSYQDFILHYAQIAQDTRVEMFSVGNELKNASRHTQEWKTIIEAVRDAYEGPLTYCDAGLINQISLVEFWDDLDYIGIDTYIPITGSGPYWDTGHSPDNDPPYDVFLSSIETALDADVKQASERYGRPVLITESGCSSVDGANQCSWCFGFSAQETAIDYNEQVQYIEALFQAVSSRDWIEGIYNFSWDLKDDYNYASSDWPFSHNPKGKPAAEAIRLWFSE